MFRTLVGKRETSLLSRESIVARSRGVRRVLVWKTDRPTRGIAAWIHEVDLVGACNPGGRDKDECTSNRLLGVVIVAAPTCSVKLEVAGLAACGQKQ